MSTLPPNYPDELLWHGRSIDPIFDAHEFLYMRVEEVDERGQFTNLDVRPNTSFNRGKYSKPEHVLYAKYPKFITWVVGGMQVYEIPAPMFSGDNKEIAFKPEHVPVKPPDADENYAHSEVRGYIGDRWAKNLPRSVEKRYREFMARKIRPVPYNAPKAPTA